MQPVFIEHLQCARYIVTGGKDMAPALGVLSDPTGNGDFVLVRMEEVGHRVGVLCRVGLLTSH
jgi:hypothetical protein